MERIEVLEDTGDLYPWDTISFFYDVIGDVEVLRYTGRIFDDGLQKTEGFNIGSLDFGFNLLTGERDIPYFPDAVVRFVDFRDGINGGPSLKPWAGITQQTIIPGDSVLTENGVVTNPTGPKIETSFTTFDDGFLDIRYWSDDVLRHVFMFDGNVGRTNWNRQHQTFDEAGNLIRQTTLFDNGILQDDLFTDGVLTTRRQSDGEFGVGNVKPWSEVITTYDLINGQQVQNNIKTTYDTGVVQTKGVRVDDLPSFNSVLRQEVVHFQTWEDGDLNGGSNEHSWSRIEETTYIPGDSLLTEDGVVTNPANDFRGVRVRREFNDDNGINRLQTFSNGQLDEKWFVDGLLEDFSLIAPGVPTGMKTWDWIVLRYNESGELSNRSISYDNGIGIGESITDGLVRFRNLTDNFDSDGDGIKPWLQIWSEYDARGNILFQNTRYDDGTSLREVFENGIVSQTVFTAPNDPQTCTFTAEGCPVFAVSRTTDFDAVGQPTQQVTVFSDGDASAFLFTDGEITERQYFDGGNDEDWVVARILFENGQRSEVITYDSLDLVPDTGIIVPLETFPGTFTGPEDPPVDPPTQETFG